MVRRNIILHFQQNLARKLIRQLLIDRERLDSVRAQPIRCPDPVRALPYIVNQELLRHLNLYAPPNPAVRQKTVKTLAAAPPLANKPARS
jgi:hypothetical protein